MVTKCGKRPASRFVIRELGRRTFPDWVRIAEKHDGVWGGCWCVTFHLSPGRSDRTAQSTGEPVPRSRRELKERLVRANRSHAALVYAGADVVGWCQFGPPAELPGRMGGYGKLDVAPPDWRITCFFVDRDRRREGIAKAALAGALRMIAAKGGGTVDGYPIATRGNYSSSFLWGGTESMFAEVGFRRVGQLGTSKLVMRKRVRGR